MSPATLNSLSQAAEALPFVHTARRYYRFDGLVRSSDRLHRSRCLGCRAAPQGQRVSRGRAYVHDRAVPPSPTLFQPPPPCAFAGLLRWPTDLTARRLSGGGGLML
ncbi:unnamed protein product [Pleuronectes platessa]|uniref:Uncharacterized protein n=1 Tax=Pleuronectes platessa TaxID=8262 RepID=A0A9N7YKV2_PLEPL|nr:unnamed protein product [Pleuronectes platessa]